MPANRLKILAAVTSARPCPQRTRRAFLASVTIMVATAFVLLAIPARLDRGRDRDPRPAVELSPEADGEPRRPRRRRLPGRPGPGGLSRGRGPLHCPLAGVDLIEVDMGPSDDKVEVLDPLPVPLAVHLGAGSDKFIGNDEPDTCYTEGSKANGCVGGGGNDRCIVTGGAANAMAAPVTTSAKEAPIATAVGVAPETTSATWAPGTTAAMAAPGTTASTVAPAPISSTEGRAMTTAMADRASGARTGARPGRGTEARRLLAHRVEPLGLAQSHPGLATAEAVEQGFPGTRRSVSCSRSRPMQNGSPWFDICPPTIPAQDDHGPGHAIAVQRLTA